MLWASSYLELKYASIWAPIRPKAIPFKHIAEAIGTHTITSGIHNPPLGEAGVLPPPIIPNESMRPVSLTPGTMSAFKLPQMSKASNYFPQIKKRVELGTRIKGHEEQVAGGTSNTVGTSSGRM